ncbi:hypothetical protein LEP1GSC070_0977 [Leptospira santarosai str. AIM]|nr:hypothetical protein LEP1GSC070_0977 [Leptospira santarosai str. AIM]
MDLDLNNNKTDFFLRGVREEELEERNVYHALLEQKEIGACVYETTFSGNRHTTGDTYFGEDHGGIRKRSESVWNV